MKHCTATRVVAVASLTCLLAAFALPAAASPWAGLTADGAWAPSLFSWVQSLWAGWFGSGDAAQGSSGIGQVHDAILDQADPNGARSASQEPQYIWPDTVY